MNEEHGLNKIVHFLRLSAFILLLLHSYYFLYPWFQFLGWTHPQVDQIFLRIVRTGLFKHVYTAKLFSLLLLAFSALGTKGMKKEYLAGKTVAYWLLFGLGLFFGSSLILQLPLP